MALISAKTFPDVSQVLWLVAQLKACTSSRNVAKGKAIHGAAVRDGHDADLYVANTLISMYAKCGCMQSARRVFDGMERASVVSWTSLISGYADDGQGKVAHLMFSIMEGFGCAPNGRTFLAALKACIDNGSKEETTGTGKCRQRASAVHSLAWRSGCDSDVYVASTLVDVYAKCNCLESAHRVFDSMKAFHVVAWNALLFGYANTGESELVLRLFSSMRRQGFVPDAQTFVPVLKACSHLAAKGELPRGKALHVLALRSGFDTDLFVANTLVGMYSKYGVMEDARSVFENMPKRCAVSWTSLMLGYADSGEGWTALVMFSRMLLEGCAPTARTFVAALKACSDLAANDHRKSNGECTERGRALHFFACKCGYSSDIYVASTLLDLYAKCGVMEDAQRVFDSISHPDVVTWTAIVAGYADNADGEAALQLFSRMKELGLQPDPRTYVAALKACASLGALEVGKKIHQEVRTWDMEHQAVLANALVDFYAKCCCLEEADLVFHSSPKKDLVTWVALMGGYSRRGDCRRLLQLFDEMRDTGLKPDSVAFKCFLTACSHAGLADQGRDCFDSMWTSYGVIPEMEHYSIMVDMLGRANKLDEAMALLNSMPLSPDAVTWMTVLGACRKWDNVEVGRLAFQSLISLDSSNLAAYVAMANIYRSRGMWREQAEMQAIRQQLKSSKQPGQSWWTNETGVVHTFCANGS